MRQIVDEEHRNIPVDPSLALPAVLKILEKWNCSSDEQILLLGIESKTTLNIYRSTKGGLRLQHDTLERMSYILKIHKCLRILFSEEESVYGWVRKPNNHPFFAGRSAMEIMGHGQIADLYAVSQHLSSWHDDLMLRRG